MSAVLSFVAPEAALLVTDAAAYDDDGIVRAITTKVHRSRSVPLAVTTRGPLAGADIAQAICNAADSNGAGAVLENLQEFVDIYGDLLKGEQFTGSNRLEVVVAGFVPGVGGVHRAFKTAPSDEESYLVYQPPDILFCGPVISTADIVSAGVTLKRESESMSEFVRRAGADILEVMRRQGGRGSKCLVGGWCDLTTISAWGAKTETIRSWPEDVVGRKIEPFAGMSRAERRRLVWAA